MTTPSADWQSFFVGELGALAALTGLVVVAISINLSRILSFAALPARAGEALLMLVGALVVTSLALIPGQSPAWLGGEWTAIGAALLIAPLANQARSWKADARVSRAKKWTRLAISLAASAPFIGGGLMAAAGVDAGFYYIAAGVIISLVAGVWNTWILLVEILR